MSIPNLPANTVYAIHLRCPSSSGGKDWVGSVTGNSEIHTFWGKTGQINQNAAKPGNNIDLQKIIGQKKNKGYQHVDDYTQKDGWASQKPQAAPATPSPSPKPKAAPQQKLNPVVDWNKTPAPACALEWDF